MRKLLTIGGLASGLMVVLTQIAPAQVIYLGGPLRPGHARPPLYVNFGPFGKSGKGGGGSTSVYYNPAQIRQAYGFDQLAADGSGQTIAIVDAYGSSSIQKDLTTFCSYFGLSPANLNTYYPQGTPGRNSGWAEETSLDVEWAHAIAPGATIALVVAKSASLNDLLGAVDYAVSTIVGAHVVSMSWGASESAGLPDQHFQVNGVTFVASSGDSGEGTSVEWPASSPYVVGVGGTSLYLDASYNRTSETAWSGSGGGISGVYSKPSWQDGWQPTSWRTVPDVSYVANPSTGVEVVYGGRLYVFGGTSVGAPQWAALVALANQGKSASLVSANTAIYSAANAGTSAADTINSTYFFDITSGSNGGDPDDSALLGYDFVTGLGSPVAGGLVPSL